MHRAPRSIRHALLPALLCLALAAAIPFAGTPEPAAAATTRWVGAYVPGAPLSASPLASLETKVGRQMKVSNYFQNTTQGFTSSQAQTATNRGTIPLITLEFWNPANGVNQSAYSLDAITSGRWDSYLRTYARSAKSFGKTVWLRPLHEMNGNWYPWGGTVNGNTPSDFVPAWRHIKNIFAAEGATNVKFVWCPNTDSVPSTSANAIAKYWPGDSYVDYVAIDGYNFGTGSSWSSWRSFSAIFKGSYAAVTPLTNKPIFIAETGCGTTGGDKAYWIKNMFAAIPLHFPRVTGFVWFNANKERDWRVESNSSSLTAFKAGLAQF